MGLCLVSILGPKTHFQLGLTEKPRYIYTKLVIHGLIYNISWHLQNTQKNTRMYDVGLREFPMALYTKFNLADNSDMRYDRDLTSLIISDESTDISYSMRILILYKQTIKPIMNIKISVTSFSSPFSFTIPEEQLNTLLRSWTECCRGDLASLCKFNPFNSQLLRITVLIYSYTGCLKKTIYTILTDMYIMKASP